MRANYLELLNDRVILVTPSRRLAGLIADRYSLAKLRADLSTWEAPPVLALGAWLADTFQRFASSPGSDIAGMILLSGEQERAVWEQVVRERGDTEPHQVEAMAALAIKAWATAILWDVPLAAIAHAGGRQEVRAFLRWAERFEQRCRDLGAIDQHRFAARLASAQTAAPAALSRFRFFGYPRLPNLLKRIATRFGGSGEVDTALETALGVPLECRAFGNSEIELNAVMAWAAQQKRERPLASVGVVLAGVSRVDSNLEQRLQRAISATSEVATPGPQISCPAGIPLADTPLVQSALSLLDRRRTRRWDEISALLLSPYLGEADAERGQRAALDFQLRRYSDVEMGIASVIDAAAAARAPCPALAARLGALMAAHDAAPRRQRMHEWMTFAENLLNVAGWPGERELTGTEQTAVTEWRRVMDAAAQLDAVLPTCSWQGAVGRWRAILRQRLFSPSAGVNAVQVLSLDEAAFLDLDALWVAGLHDGAWPESIEVSPLLPFPLQREYFVPGANPAHELIHAEAVLGRLRARNRDAIWSYACVEGETPRRPLMGSVSFPGAPSPAAVWPRIANDNRFAVIDDTYAAGSNGAQGVGGGVALFSDQAACPFRALARHRLVARAPEDASPGLNGM